MSVAHLSPTQAAQTSAVSKSAVVATAAPAVRKWLMDLLRRGERANAGSAPSKRRVRQSDRLAQAKS
jgi:hypothetical protein